MPDGLRTLVKQTFVGVTFSYVLLRLDIDGGRLPHVVVGRMHYVCYEYKFRVKGLIIGECIFRTFTCFRSYLRHLLAMS